MGDLVPLYPDGQPYDGLVCDKCGSAWWNAQVVMDRSGRINGWGLVADCAECAEGKATITGDVHNDR